MIRIDRYILSQLLVLFGFFALVLVAVSWINRAVVLFDRLISDGQSAMVFLEFTTLGLPRLITTVMPIAAFAASVYVTNRLNNESELTVLQATGSSPFRLARAPLYFGLIVFAMSSVLYHFLQPMSLNQLGVREAQVSQNATGRLLTEGTFLHPSDGVTFYTGRIDEDGVLWDVFLSDQRDDAEGVIYTARQAYLLRSGEDTTLIMVNGLAQRLNNQSNRLATANFVDFSFDISNLVKTTSGQVPIARNLTTPALMTASWADLSASTGQSIGTITEEFHTRFSRPLFCIVAAMIGFSTLLLGGYSRFGVWRETGVAFALLLLLDGIGSAFQKPVRGDPSLWPAMYLPSLVGILLTLGMLWAAARPGLFLRRRRVAAA